MKQNPAPASVFAGRAERLLAYLIDSLALFALIWLLTTLLGGDETSGIVVIGAFACQAFYYTYFTASEWQATPGQRLLAIHVVRRDGRPLGMSDGLQRFLAFIFPVLPLYASYLPGDIAQVITTWLIVIWFAPILFTEQRVGMHDRICDMRVVTGKR